MIRSLDACIAGDTPPLRLGPSSDKATTAVSKRSVTRSIEISQGTNADLGVRASRSRTELASARAGIDLGINDKGAALRDATP